MSVGSHFYPTPHPRQGRRADTGHVHLFARTGHGVDGNEVSRDTFPLPKLGVVLDKICSDVYEGRGFGIVRGLDPDAFSIEDLTVVYLGISSYIGERRGKQDQRGSMLSKWS